MQAVNVRLVTRRAQTLGLPADHVDGGFTDGVLRPDAPVAARYAQAVAVALRAALDDDGSLADLARRAGLARSTVQSLLSGRNWPDLVTLAVLEDALDVRLWPDRGDLAG